MSAMAKSAREKMKAKAQRLVGMSNTETPFYPQGENASDKTGLRPISPRQYKKGGKVVGKAVGLSSAARADRAKRKAGGRCNIAEEMMNRDLKAANKDRKGGKDHIGGLKKGGSVKKEGGGSLLKRMVGSPKTGSDMSEVGKQGTAKYSSSDKAEMQRVMRDASSNERYKKGGKVKKLGGGALSDAIEEAMSGKGKSGRSLGNDTEGAVRKRGGKVKKAIGGNVGDKSKMGVNEIDSARNMLANARDAGYYGGGASGLYTSSMRKNGGKIGKGKGKGKDAEDSKSKFKKSFLKDGERNLFAAPSSAAPKSPRKPVKVVDQTMGMESDGEEMPEDREVFNNAVMKKGGRVKKYGGGALDLGMGDKKTVKSKGKSNITIPIIIAPQGGNGSAQQPPMVAGPREPAPTLPQAPMGGGMPPMPPMGGAGAPPMGAPPMGAPPMGGPMGEPPMGAPPMGGGLPPQLAAALDKAPRKSGGRVKGTYASLKAGAGSGLGRLKKAGLPLSH